jgi:hypothetical protein
MLEHPDGGVILIGGFGNENHFDFLFHLSHVGDGATWTLMKQKLNTPRSYHTAFLIPNDLTTCYPGFQTFFSSNFVFLTALQLAIEILYYFTT